MADRELVRFYYDTISLNEHLMQWYRAVFVAFHGGIVLAMMLIATRSEDFGAFRCPLLAFGLLVSLLWIWLTSQRARIVYTQKTKMLSVVDERLDPDIKNCLSFYKSKSAKFLPEFIFNLFLPLAVGFLLIAMCDYSLHNHLTWVWSTAIGAPFFLLSVFVWSVYEFHCAGQLKQPGGQTPNERH